MDTLTPLDVLASLYTEDPFCAQEGVKTLESNVHHENLLQVENDLRLHLRACDLSYTLTSDLLIRNIPLREGVSPDIALWPGREVLQEGIEYGSLALSADLRPALILEIVSESTQEADAVTKHEIYRLAAITEYWLYDPMGHAGGPPLRGWRLEGTEYTPVRGHRGVVAGAEVALYTSRVLETDWGLADGADLRLLNPQQDGWYQMDPAGLQHAEARAEQAEDSARQAEAQARQAEAQARQAETQARQAEAQADQYLAEIARLRALLDQRSD